MKNKKLSKKAPLRLFLIFGAAVLIIVVLTFIGHALIRTINAQRERQAASAGLPDYIDVQLIDVDGHARRGVKLDGPVRDIVIHYVGNPMTSAQNNRDYFNNEGTTVSSHFVVGLEGEIIMCVPLDEKSSASNDRNSDTISIEVCHEDETGKFNDATYHSLVKLTAWLCDKYNLDTDHIIRHYDITGKICPKYFVEHEDEWEKFKLEVKSSIMQDNN